MFAIKVKYPALPRKWRRDILIIALENFKKSPQEHFTEKPILFNFENLSTRS